MLQTVADQAETLRSQRDLLAKQAEMMAIYTTEQSWLSSFSPYFATDLLGGARRDLLFSQAYAGTGGIMGGNSGVAATAAGMDALITKSLAAESNVDKANQALSKARDRGLYDNGELIAVLPPTESAVTPAAGKGD
jgi:hypothetical protein